MLDKKDKLILKKIIEIYLDTSEPVSSLKISKHLSFSPSSIRQRIARLYKNKFLTKDINFDPKANKGKIPTNKSYQYYANNLIDTLDFNDEIILKIKDLIKLNLTNTKEILNKVCELISEISQLPVLVKSNYIQSETIIDIVTKRINNSLTIIFIKSNGDTYTHKAQFDSLKNAEGFASCLNILKSRIKSIKISKIIDSLEAIKPILAKLIDNYSSNLEFRLVNLFKSIFLDYKYRTGFNDLVLYNSKISKQILNIFKLIENNSIWKIIEENSIKKKGTIRLIALDSDNQNSNTILSKDIIIKDQQHTFSIVGPNNKINYQKVIGLLNLLQQISNEK